MAKRMQQRRGTAAQWISTNDGDGPILNVGEIGFETDTGKFKMGDGVNHWIDLDYFLDESEINSITGDYIPTSTLAQPNGVATLDGSGKLTSSQVPNIDELAQDAVDAALVAGTGLEKTYNDGLDTITLGIDSTIATKTYADDAADAADTSARGYADSLASNYDPAGSAATVSGNLTSHESDTSTHGVGTIVGTSESQTLTNKTISYADNTLTVQVANVSDLTATATELNTLDGITASTTELNYVDGVTSSIQTQLDDKMPKTGGTFSGTVYGTNLELSGNLTVDGTFSSVPTETLVVTNPMIYMGEDNPANINDLGFVASHTIDSTYSHTGLVKDATDGKWKLFTGVTDEPTTTVNFGQGTLDTLAVATLEGNVTGDLTGNADTATALETARNIAGQSFDGTADISIAPTDLIGVTATATEINILDGATLSTIELNYLDGVTSSIQNQIDGKLSSSTAESTYAPLASPTFTGTVTLPNSTVTNNMLAGSITNAKLTNSAITINGSSVSLGGSATIPTGATAQAVSSNISIQHNYNYFVDTSVARTLTLPSSPSLGDTIAIIDASGIAATNKITVASNGGKINGTVQNLEIDVNNAAAVLLYTGSTYGWRVG